MSSSFCNHVANRNRTRGPFIEMGFTRKGVLVGLRSLQRKHHFQPSHCIALKRYMLDQFLRGYCKHIEESYKKFLRICGVLWVFVHARSQLLYASESRIPFLGIAGTVNARRKYHVFKNITSIISVAPR